MKKGREKEEGKVENERGVERRALDTENLLSLVQNETQSTYIAGKNAGEVVTTITK